MHPTLLGLEAHKNMLLDKIHHIHGDHPELSEDEIKEEVGQLSFSLRLLEHNQKIIKERIEKSKEDTNILLG